MSDVIAGYFPYVQHIANNFIIFTPLFSYGTTCYSIHKKQTSDGFSIDICATMLMALILRIFYYLVQPYEFALVVQLCVMIFIHCVLLKVSLHYRSKEYNSDFLQPYPSFSDELETKLMSIENLYMTPSSVEYDYHDVALKYLARVSCYTLLLFKHAVNFFDGHFKRPYLFWQWNEPQRYWAFLMKFTIFFGLLTAIFHNNEWFGSFVGILGLFIEALLPLPQILLLNRFQSIKNFKVILLISWLCGDCTKITYLLYGTSNISLIFIAAALFQMGLDFVIALQYFRYKKLEYIEDSVV